MNINWLVSKWYEFLQKEDFEQKTKFLYLFKKKYTKQLLYINKHRIPKTKMNNHKSN